MNNIFSPKLAQILRIAIGAVFGLLIALLIETTPNKNDVQNPEIWRATLLGVIYLTAFVYWAGLGAMRKKSLLIWGISASIIIAIIFHHSASQDSQNQFLGSANILWILPFLFITHELVSSGDQANKIIAPYDTYFDEAWKRGVQLALALAFTGVFWLILFLGAKLLNIIGLVWFEKLIEETYFIWPASGIAMASAVHLGDVQPKLLNNFRNLVLSIFSWLLPIIVLVAGIFAVSLLFTGLKPLWETKAATASLLTACMFLVLLINAAYQNGENKLNPILKIALRIATFETAVFAIIAGYSLWLRIDQYGLTHERILALIGVIVATCYGVFYTIANFINIKDAQFMAKIQEINIGMAFIKSLIFFCILTPIADPSRLSVNSQVKMLLNGKTKIDKFDWDFLRFDSGKYGLKALEKLKKSSDPKIAAEALEASKRVVEVSLFDKAPQPENLAPPILDNVSIIKGSEPLPESFKTQKFDMLNSYNVPPCILKDNQKQHCDISLLDLNDDKQKEIIFFGNWYIYVATYNGKEWLFMQSQSQAHNDQLRNAFKNGEIKSQKPKWNDLNIGNQTIKLIPNEQLNSYVAPETSEPIVKK